MLFAGIFIAHRFLALWRSGLCIGAVIRANTLYLYSRSVEGATFSLGRRLQGLQRLQHVHEADSNDVEPGEQQRMTRLYFVVRNIQILRLCKKAITLLVVCVLELQSSLFLCHQTSLGLHCQQSE
jgi:hypothetical protein